MQVAAERRPICLTERGPYLRDSTNLLVPVHICQPEFRDSANMGQFYERAKLVPHTEFADVALIRSHIAYWSTTFEAEGLTIKRERGRAYRVKDADGRVNRVLRIFDYYDHRNGVTGWR